MEENSGRLSSFFRKYGAMKSSNEESLLRAFSPGDQNVVDNNEYEQKYEIDNEYSDEDSDEENVTLIRNKGTFQPSSNKLIAFRKTFYRKFRFPRSRNSESKFNETHQYERSSSVNSFEDPLKGSKISQVINLCSRIIAYIASKLNPPSVIVTTQQQTAQASTNAFKRILNKLTQFFNTFLHILSYFKTFLLVIYLLVCIIILMTNSDEGPNHSQLVV